MLRAARNGLGDKKLWKQAGQWREADAAAQWSTTNIVRKQRVLQLQLLLHNTTDCSLHPDKENGQTN